MRNTSCDNGVCNVFAIVAIGLVVPNHIHSFQLLIGRRHEGATNIGSGLGPGALFHRYMECNDGTSVQQVQCVTPCGGQATKDVAGDMVGPVVP